jgi:dGTPase
MIEFQNELKSLKEISFEKLYSYRPVLEIEAAGFSIINGLLEFIFQIKKDPANKQYKKISSLLPKIVTKEDLSYESILDVTDFISGMTDWYAIDLYNKITGVTLPELY